MGKQYTQKGIKYRELKQIKKSVKKTEKKKQKIDDRKKGSRLQLYFSEELTYPCV